MERRDSVHARERRVIAAPGLRVETRAKGDAKSQRIVGHASVFDVWTVLYESRWYRWSEVVRPGAYSRAIAEKQDVRSLFNHDPNFVLGRTASGTLDLSEDAVGLLSDTDAPDTQSVRDFVLAPIARKDITQMSFAFTPNNTKAVVTSIEGVTVADYGGQRVTIRCEGDLTIEERELLDVDLFDVSPVTYPAYESTDVALRTLGERREKEIHQGKGSRRSSRLSAMRLRHLEASLIL